MRVRYSFSSRRTRQIEPGNKHKQAFPKLAKEVIRISDIVLEVLDARFIEKTRNLELETLVRELEKKLIYVINKSDLVNLEEIQQKIEDLQLTPYVIVSCKSPQGRKFLRDRIKIEIKKMNIKHAKAHVGVVGYPNTGKSTLINVLAGGGRAQASAQAGFTKGIRKIRFTKDILILDTPGVIAELDSPSSQKEDMKKTAEIGVKTYSSIKDPYSAIMPLLEKHGEAIKKHYQLDSQLDSEQLVEQLGRSRHLLKKGNLVDTDKAARLILKDWQEGKIKP